MWLGRQSMEYTIPNQQIQRGTGCSGKRSGFNWFVPKYLRDTRSVSQKWPIRLCQDVFDLKRRLRRPHFWWRPQLSLTPSHKQAADMWTHCDKRLGNYACTQEEVSGAMFGEIFGPKLITGWDPSVCKSNRLHVDISGFPLLNWGTFYRFF